MGQRSGPRILMLCRTFSTSAGGRTRATFARASALARTGLPVAIVTLDHKIGYEEILRQWRSRVDLPSAVEHLNLFEDLAGEPLYVVEPPVPPAHEPSCPPGLELVVRRRKDTSLHLVERHRDGVLVRREHYDRQSRPRVVTEVAEDRSTTETYLAPSGHVFLVLHRHGRVVTARRPGQDEVTWQELASRWIAALDAQVPSVVICDDRRSDDLLATRAAAGTVPSVLVIHSSHLSPDVDDVAAVTPYNGRALETADEFDRIVVLTERQRRDIEAHFGPRPHLRVVPHAIEASPPRRRPRRRPPTFVVATRLVAVKQLDHVLEAFAVVLERHPQARLVIAGTGDLQNDLERHATDLHLGPAVSFPGYVEDPATLLSGAVATVCSSAMEGFGLSVLESLAAGVPVVSYDVRYGPSDIIEHGRTGLLVEPGDVAALAEAMTRVVRERRWRSRRTRRRCVAGAARFSQDEYVERWSRIIDELSTSRPS